MGCLTGEQQERQETSAFLPKSASFIFVSRCEHHKEDPLHATHVGNPKKGEEMKNL